MAERGRPNTPSPDRSLDGAADETLRSTHLARRAARIRAIEHARRQSRRQSASPFPGQSAHTAPADPVRGGIPAYRWFRGALLLPGFPSRGSAIAHAAISLVPFVTSPAPGHSPSRRSRCAVWPQTRSADGDHSDGLSSCRDGYTTCRFTPAQASSAGSGVVFDANGWLGVASTIFVLAGVVAFLAAAAAGLMCLVTPAGQVATRLM
jgi:hypothetical protein